MNYPLRANRRIALCIVLVLLLAAWAAPSAQAAVTPWTLTQLTLSADLIVRGRIAWQSSRWDDEKTTIFTISTLAVTDQIKGHEDSKLLAIKTPGGVVGNVGLTVSPAAYFVPREEVLVFLEKLDADVYVVTGSIQGKYAVRDGWAVNEEMGTAMPLIPFVSRVLAIMETHGLVSSLPPDWASRFPPATASPPLVFQPLGFAYDGVHWPGPDPMGEPYLVNLNTTDVPLDQALEAIQAAADTWTNVSGADFEFSYGGSTTATDYSNPPNGQNDIMWKDNGPNQGILAMTWTWRNEADEIFESDMVINDYYQWDTSGTPGETEFDLQSVALHEFGHYLRLEHDIDPDAVMYRLTSAGSVKRALHPNDIAGIRYIYPAACLSDFDDDGFVTVDDIAEITSRWRFKAADPWPPGSERYDLNDDKVINILDVMMAVTEMGGNC